MNLRVPLLIALIAGAASAVLCWQVLGLIPHVADEVSYVFQGMIFGSGKLWLDPPAVPEVFAIDHIVITPNRWCSIYTPGWPLLLAFGWLVQVPWIVNPLLVVLSVLGVWRLGISLFDNRTAVIASVLFAVSPFVLLMGAGLMSHMSALCASVWCMVALTAAAKSPGSRNLMLAGLLAGFLFLIRPFTAIVLLWPAVLWCLWHRKTEWLRTAAALLPGFLPSLALLFLYNTLVFGGPLKTGYDLDPSWNLIQFHISNFASNFVWYIKALNHSLWGWPFPGLLILLPLLRPRAEWKTDLMLAICACSLLCGYCFLSYRDIVYGGPRYVFEMMGCVSLLTARSLLSLYDLFQARRVVRLTFKITFVLLILFSLAVRFPEQIRYHSEMYHGQSHELAGTIKSRAGKSALILVSGDPYIFRSFFFENSLNPAEGNRIFVRDIPGFRNRLMDVYPRKEMWKASINLQALPGSNTYPDHFLLKDFRMERLK